MTYEDYLNTAEAQLRAKAHKAIRQAALEEAAVLIEEALLPEEGGTRLAAAIRKLGEKECPDLAPTRSDTPQKGPRKAV